MSLKVQKFESLKVDNQLSEPFNFQNFQTQKHLFGGISSAG
jgi:hypothetical protein